MLTMTSALAATVTVSVTNVDPDRDATNAGETYNIYKIFDAVKSSGTSVTTSGTSQSLSDGGAITYKISTSNDWFSILFNNDGTAKTGNDWFTARAIPGESGVFEVIPAADYTTEAKAIAAATWLKGKIVSGSPTATKTITAPNKGGTAVSETVDDGYYLITSSLGTNLGLATTEFPMSIIEKNTYPSIDKSQKDGEAAASANYSDNSVDVQVGDTINYKVVVFVPGTASSDITVTDTMSAGLTPGAVDTVTTAVGTAYNESTKEITLADPAITLGDSDVVIDAGTSPLTYQITIHPTENTKGKFIQFTFSATVDSDALTDTDKKNEVTLTYSNYSQTDSVPYAIYMTGVVKYDGQNNTVTPDANNVLPDGTTYLASAEFELYEDDAFTTKINVALNGSVYYPDASGTAVITSVDNATGIKIRGLDNQTYYLKEIKAPDGYTLITNAIPLVVEADSDSAVTEPAKVKVSNNKGAVLPSTGGVGTTIFYVAGSILVLAAAILLITKRRMGAND